MKRFACIILIISFSIIACKTKYGIEREIKPLNKYEADIINIRCSTMSSANFDAVSEPINNSHWEDLLDIKMFQKNGGKISRRRIPKMTFFHIGIFNKGNKYIVLDKIKLHYDNKAWSPLSIKEVKKRCKSPMFSLFNFKRILSSRRLLSNNMCLKEIDYELNTIDYKFKYIVPGDRIIKIYAFEWIPIEIRTFILTIVIKSQNMKKRIDFNFKRYEYRTRGKYFLKPEEKYDLELEYGD
ncbi:MAG: hypothetical protein SVR08_10500 [Spirochaetota bacterium]|nr:hypothetical protein [Spirochaetota bacterium]